jgi:hypothetical protein
MPTRIDLRGIESLGLIAAIAITADLRLRSPAASEPAAAPPVDRDEEARVARRLAEGAERRARKQARRAARAAASRRGPPRKKCGD